MSVAINFVKRSANGRYSITADGTLYSKDSNGFFVVSYDNSVEDFEYSWQLADEESAILAYEFSQELA